MKSREHYWSLNDCILGLYVNKFGTHNIGNDINDIVTNVIGSTIGSLICQGRMYLHLIDDMQGLPHSGFALRFVKEKYGHFTESDLRDVVIRILNDNPNDWDKKMNNTYKLRRRVEFQNTNLSRKFI